MAEEESPQVPKESIEAINEGNGQPTSEKHQVSKRKAKTSQIEKKCLCNKSTRDLLCPSHGERKWLRRNSNG